MDIKPIKIDADYGAALKEIESLMMAGPDTPEGEKLAAHPNLRSASKANTARNFKSGRRSGRKKTGRLQR